MKIGIIGGPYFWKFWDTTPKEVKTKTPFGTPAANLCQGEMQSHTITTLMRHGPQNQLSPSEIPYLANVYALGETTPDFVIHVSLCGALYADAKPGDIFLFDQLIDQTKVRARSFGRKLFEYDHHLDFGSPVSEELVSHAHEVLATRKINHKTKGIMLTEEGPQFSTAAEANMFRLWGADALNMTSCPEIYLFRELGIPVLPMCLVSNIVGENSSIRTEDIVNNVKQHSTVIPSAVKAIIEEIKEDFVLKKPEENYYDVMSLDVVK